MKKTSLQDQARLTFPNALQEVLLGCGVGRNNLTPQSIPLSRNRNKANIYLKYMHRCGLDDDDTHLATLISTMNLYTSEEISNESLLLGIDYTRDPKNDFPRAHIPMPEWLGAGATQVERRQNTLRPASSVVA